MLAEDPRSRVAVETLITTGLVHVAGEVTTEGYVDIPAIVRDTILRIGYDSSKKGFDGASCGVSVSIGSQSPDIAQGVDSAVELREGSSESALDAQGAGDQGMMFGFACSETPELMPLPIALAHRLARRLSAARKDGTIPYLRPDGKTQVTIEYDGLRPVRLDTVVVSSQHAADISLESLLTPDVREHVIGPELEGLGLDTENYRLLVNPTGRFEIGGPMGDAGLTGRKIIVDTYGGYAPHPARPLGDGGPKGRRRPPRPQDHRRPLRRLRPPRRRRVLRQGPVQGGPVRGLRDALGRQERRRGRPRRALRDPGRVRDRQGAP